VLSEFKGQAAQPVGLTVRVATKAWADETHRANALEDTGVQPRSPSVIGHPHF